MCNKWRILHRSIDVKLDFAENIVKSICVLHNFVRIRDGITYEDTLHAAPLSNMNRSHIKFELYFVNQGKLHWQDGMI